VSLFSESFRNGTPLYSQQTFSGSFSLGYFHCHQPCHWGKSYDDTNRKANNGKGHDAKDEEQQSFSE
jgi:hypothetical protein